MLKAQILVDALQAFRESYGHGAWAEIARKTGLSPAAISKIASGAVEPSLESWMSIHVAFRDQIPFPAFNDEMDELFDKAFEDVRRRRGPNEDRFYNLRLALKRHLASYPDESQPFEFLVNLARDHGVKLDAAQLERIIDNEEEPSPSLLDKLWQLDPGAFPAPPEVEELKRATETGHDYEVRLFDTIGLVKIPVFDAGAGEPSTFSDGGYPVGEASEYILVDGSRTDDNTFAVQIHGDSMEPYLHEGDKVVVVPSAELQNGKLCFATWPGETSDRLVKRYRKVGDNIILESDNKEHEPIVLDANNGHGVRIYRVTQSVRDE